MSREVCDHNKLIDSDCAECATEASKSRLNGLLNEWIPTSERLPDHSDELLLVYGATVYIGRFLGYGPDKIRPRWETDSLTGSLMVSHWMPLPEPPVI